MQTPQSEGFREPGILLSKGRGRWMQRGNKEERQRSRETETEKDRETERDTGWVIPTLGKDQASFLSPLIQMLLLQKYPHRHTQKCFTHVCAYLYPLN